VDETTPAHAAESGGSLPGEPPKKGSVRNVFRWIGRSFAQRSKLTGILVILFVASILAVIIERNLYQPYAIVARAYSGVPFALLGLFVLTWLTLTICRLRKLRVIWYVIVMGLGMGGIVWGKSLHDYTTAFLRFGTLELVDIEKLPLTDNERVLPQAAVYWLIASLTNMTTTSTQPSLVRVGDIYEWTAAIAPNPSFLWQNLFGKVEEVVHLPAVSASTALSTKTRSRASFTEGEYMLLGANIDTCVRRSFGPLRFWNYEPGNTVFIKDDTGEWVQAVTLIRWAGWLFPWPEFGGVQLIRQTQARDIVRSSDILAVVQDIALNGWSEISRVLSRLTLGCGEWIPPEDVQKHTFLRGQNIVPFAVTRYNALSLGFQQGFWAKAAGYREGDLRIPDLPSDLNDQPFTLFARMAEYGGQDKLYQYVALEPVDTSRSGLSTSYFGPADGIGPVFRAQHYKSSNCLGVSAISGIVKGKAAATIGTRVPVEHRLYVKELADALGRIDRRFFWMTSVLTRNEGRPGYAIEASPMLFFTDMCTRISEPVSDPSDPESWPAELQRANAREWARQ